MKNSIIVVLCVFAMSAGAANNPSGQGPIIIENGYVADPHDVNQNPENPQEKEPKTYDDPYQYDYDNVMSHDNEHELEEDRAMGGKYNGGIHGVGMHGGGGGRR